MIGIKEIKAFLEIRKLKKAIVNINWVSLLKSRTVWMFVLMAVFNGLVDGIESIKDQLPPEALAVINPIMALIGIFFRVKPKQVI